MKRILVTTLVLLVMLAAVPVVKLMRFEVINKSGQVASLKLQEVNFDVPTPYYLTLAKGDALPSVRLFTLVRGVYDMEVWSCGAVQPSVFLNYDLTGAKARFVVLPCAMREAQSGDGVLKVNPWLYPFEDPFGVPLIYDLGGVYHWRY